MRLIARRVPEIVDGIEIRGEDAFRARTKAALQCLRRRPGFAEVRNHIAVIREGRRSGMWARRTKPTFVVGKRTWEHSVTWYAGAIAHDAYHSKLYREAKLNNGGKEPESRAWTGPEAEKQCLAYQRRVLEDLSADDGVVAYLRECEKNPTYQGAARGLKGWLDYLRRGW